MDDGEVLGRINELASEEHELFERESHEKATDADRMRHKRGHWVWVGGFWNVRGPQLADGYPVLVAGAVLSAALPLMIPSAGPQYVTVAVPLMTVLLAETWRRQGAGVVTGVMIVWSIALKAPGCR